MKRARVCIALLGVAVSISADAADPIWSGSATCDVAISGTGYTDRQTHTWHTTGGAPTKRGAFLIYPGVWSVSGGGSLMRTQGDQTLSARWTRSVTDMSGPISVVRRASDGVVLIGAGHAQLRARDAVTGVQEVRRGGKIISSTKIGSEQFEHAFPSITVNAKGGYATGQKSETPVGSFGLMQPGGSTVHVNCTWAFQRPDDGGEAQAAAPVAPPATTPPPRSASCDAQLAQVSAEYQQMEADYEKYFDQLLRIAKTDAERAATEKQKADFIAALRKSAEDAAAAVRTSCGRPK
jgi:hypothetical protein